MDELAGHYANQSKPERKRQMFYGIICIWKPKKAKQNKTNKKDDFTENRVVVARHWVRENGEKKLKGTKFQL